MSRYNSAVNNQRAIVGRPSQRGGWPISWGDTRDPKSANRRIYLTNFARGLNIDQLTQYFGGREVLDGVTLFQFHAFITFKRHTDYMQALGRDSMEFQGAFITVKPFSKMPPKKGRSRTPERQIIPRRARERTRSRSRSRSRSRGRSPSRRQSRPPSSARAPSHQQSEPSGWTEKDYDNYVTHRTQIGLQTAQNNYNMHSQMNQLNQPGYSAVRQPGPSAIVPFSGNLPSDIELTLKLVLEHKTARSLSLIQIQNVINFLEQEKIGIRNNETIPVVPTTPQFMHIPVRFDYRQVPIDPALVANNGKSDDGQKQNNEPEPPKTNQESINVEDDLSETIPEGLSDSLRLLTDAISFR